MALSRSGGAREAGATPSAPQASSTGGGRRPVIWLVAASLAAPAAMLLLMYALGIPGWDSAAHLYKTWLLRHGGSVLWDDYWYGGTYGVITYGVVYYWLARFVGGGVLVFVSAAALPLLLGLYLRRAWGVTTWRPAWALVVVLPVYLLNGQDPFLLGLAFMMGALVLLACGRPLVGALAAGVSLFTNPLALVVGGSFLLADFVARPRSRRRTLCWVAALSPFAIAWVVLMVLFRQPAWYLDQWAEILVWIGYGVIGFALARRSDDPERRAKEILFLGYAGLCLAALAVPGLTLGNNVGRFAMIFGLPLLFGIERPRLPLVVLLAATVTVGWIQLAPPLKHVIGASDLASTRSSFWAPALSEAGHLYDPSFRFHVVAPRRHWEAYYFPIHGYAITRGWYRQADAIHNGLFYRDYDTAAYIAWLRSVGVRYVFLPHATLDQWSTREPGILAGATAFTRVFEDRDWTVYRFDEAEPIVVPLAVWPRGASPGDVRGRGGSAAPVPVARLSGGDRPAVVTYGSRSLALRLPLPGWYLVKVSWTPYWRLRRPGASAAGSSHGLSRTRDDFVRVRVDAGGMVELRF